MIRVGIIGCGYWGPNLIRVFHDCDGSTVTTICDRDSARIAQLQRRYPSVEGVLDASELVGRKDVDLVVVATPVDSHFDIARAAIKAGKHVLVEKPMTANSAQAETLIDLARANGVLLAVDHTFLFTPAVEKIKSLLDDGTIGKVDYIDSVRINLGLIQEEANVIWDLAPHDLSIVDHLIGQMPDRIVATGGCHNAGGQVDVAYINLAFSDGLVANFHVNWLSPVKVRRMIFGGSKRMVIFDDLSSNEKVRVFDTGATPVWESEDSQHKRLRRVDYRLGDIWTPHLKPTEALAAEAAHIVSAITTGEPLRADGQAGLRVIRILEACHESLCADGGRVLLQRSKPTSDVIPSMSGADPVGLGAPISHADGERYTTQEYTGPFPAGS